LTQRIVEKLKVIVEKVGKTGKYEIILQSVVIYGPDVTDLTDEVIKTYNKGKS